MTTDDILTAVNALSPSEKEDFYLKVMDDYFRTMMNNQEFMEEAFHCMAAYLSQMKGMGLNVEGIIADMGAGIGMKKAASA